MTRVFIFSAILMIFQSASAHDKQFITGPLESGFYVAPEIKNCHFLLQFEQFLGARGGWIINHKLTIGGAWYKMISEREIVYYAPGVDFIITRIKAGYGGLLLEYEIDPGSREHVTIDMLIGAGSISLKKGRYFDLSVKDYYFVAEPGMNFTHNFSRNIRVNLGLGYHLAYDVEFHYYKNEDLTGATARFFLKFGSF